MSDYKDTINLPKTKFPMKANLAQREPELLKRWQEMNIFDTLAKQWADKPKFVLHDGPPYANGHTHLGHAVNKTLKDIVNKSRMLSGFAVPYVPGWDCHGLPIELNVEKKKGKAGLQISPEHFRQECRTYARTQIKIQSEEFQRLGVIGDWQHPYLTMAHGYEANIVRALAKIIENGHLFRGQKPVHWCVDCGSALAEAEVEYKDKSSPSIDVKFAVIDPATLLNRCDGVHHEFKNIDIDVVIWTTTPWTLPANQAVAVHPEMEYVVVHCDKGNEKHSLLIADALLKDTMLRYGIEKYHVIGYCRGEALEGLKLKHPFYDRIVPMILAEHVTMESGTGAVHTAPAHGQEDYIVATRYKLPVENPVDDEGKFKTDIPLFAGEFIFTANQHIIDTLNKNNRLLHAEVIQHSYPHCWRHKTPLIFRATPQWFISMDQKELRQKALAAIEEVSWFPDWGKKRMAGMIESRPDWCISRQRTWGVPLTLITHKRTDELHPNMTELMQVIAKKMDEKGIEAWYELELEDLIPEEASLYKKSTDVLDVWFESGVSHFAYVAQNPDLQFPVDIYLEGSDQHRGWFQSGLLTSVAMHGIAPYKAVLTHGFTIDSQGRKMSKSLGNVIPPEKVIKTLGADVLRLWISSVDYRAEMALSDEILKRNSDAYRRIRNTARYLLANLADFDPEQHQVPTDAVLSLDRWAIDKARRLQQELIQAYDEYQFHVVYQKIHHFCSIDMGGFYLDIIKDRQYTMQIDSLARRSAQTAMYHIVEALARWIAPILTFTAEEIWQYIPGEHNESVFLNTWYDDFISLSDTDIMNAEYWQTVQTIRDEVNKQLEALRNDNKIGSGLDADVMLYCNSELAEKLEKLGDELRFVFITSSANVTNSDKHPDRAIKTELDGLAIQVTPSNKEKCVRCWHRRAEIGVDKEHPELCSRCVTNVAGSGEERNYA